jgi:glycosyltransferase involved in cell wall biosynthesis
MKIIHVARRYWPYQGGVEHHLSQLNQELIADGHSVSVVTLAHHSKLLKVETHQQVTIVRLPVISWTWFKRLQSIKFLGIFAKSIEKLHRWYYVLRLIPFFKQAQVVQIHDVYWWLAPWWWLIPGKLFMTFHGYESELGPTRSQKIWHQLAASVTDGTLGIGNFHEKWYGVTPDITSFGAVTLNNSAYSHHSNQSHLLNQAHHSNQLHHSNQSHLLNQAQDKIRVVFIGRLQKLTGAETLVEAVAQLPLELQQRLTVDVYGEGELYDSLLQKMADSSLPITFYGFQAEARAELFKAELAVVSQYLSLLEALLARVKIISFAGSDFKRSVLELTPFSKKIKIVASVNEMANQLQNVIESSSKNSKQELEADEAYHWVKVQTWRALVNQYYQLWKL